MYSVIVVKLSELLGKRFIREEDFKSPIGRALAGVMNYHNSGRYEERDYELARLLMLVKHLEEIKKYDVNLLNELRSKINRDDANYFGFRFEVAIASSLIRKKVKFIKTESPDYKISHNGKEIYIETTSTHITKPSLKDLKHKIKAAIRKKSKKNYCQPNTALFIDITNIYFHNLLRKQLIQSKELKNYVKDILKKAKFGSVVMFAYILNKKLNRFELNYIRVDSEAIDPILRDFLDKYYPIKGHIVQEFAIPDRG